MKSPTLQFSEGLTRTNTTRGPSILTFTPLKGISQVVKRYLREPSPDRHVTTMTLWDAAHYSDEDRERILAQYPEHERATRTRGIPAMGSGAVFLVDPDKLLVDPFECPSHWVRLGGMDFGWDHPSAFVECWWDRDLDIFYLVRTLRLRHKTRCSTSTPCGRGGCAGPGRMTAKTKHWPGPGDLLPQYVTPAWT